MSFDNSELLNDFVVEANEHLAEIENQLLEIEANGANVNVDLVNTVFRAIHSIKGAAGFLGLSSIGSLSHSLENVLNLIRAEELTPTPGIVDVMLKSADQLASMVEDVANSNDVNVSELSQKLDKIAENLGMPEENGDAPAPAPATDPEEAAAEQIAEQIAEIQPEVNAAQESAAEEEEDEMDRQIRLAFEAREKAMAAINQKAENAGGTATAAPPATEKKEAAQTAQAVSKPEKAEVKPQVESSIRVSVSVLDQLMNLAGELVLARNQLLQTINGSAANVAQKSGRSSALETVTAGIDQVTSELQEAIMQTRMQPIGTVFNRFPRVVRDLSSKLNKQIDLDMEGVEVEVDKTIVEAIGDPLTHLVRNSVDHGVEAPAERERRNKKPTGRICLRAYHQAGKVRIDIEDDGRGIDPDIIRVKACEKGVITEDQMDRITDRDAVRLIFHPGFSTAAKVTDISGRGVGMDVVKTNIEKLGGTVDIDSTVGVGTTIRVTLPLTLAIVPSLIVESGGDRYAIPQSSIVELVRVRHSELNEKIGRVKNAEVLRLRGNLLPLVRLSEALNLDETRRKSKMQSTSKDLAKLKGEAKPEDATELTEDVASTPRAINIVVVEATQFRYGLVVDALHESEEIVVKPLGTHLREIQSLAGATILGDGHIALILDVGGIASHRELTSVAESKSNTTGDAREKKGDEAERQMALLFTNHSSEQFAIPMSVITRIERSSLEDIDDIGGDLLMRYQGGSLPLLALSRLVSCKQPEERESFYVVVFEVNGIEIGLIAPELSDIREINCKIDSMASETIGVMGTFVLENRTTRYLNLYELAEKAHPQWFIEQRQDTEISPQEFKLLLVEDSSFFRRQVKKFIKSEGFQIIEAEDGVDGWNKLNDANGSVDLIVSDIEMPNMNGFELCSRIREDERFKKLPAIALTSLADPSDVERGKQVGFDDYQVKMDKAALIASINNLLQKAQKKAKR